MSSSSPQPPIPDLVFLLCCLTNFWYHQPPPLKSETWSLSPLLPISTALLQTCSLAHLAYGNTSQAQPYSSPIPSTSSNLLATQQQEQSWPQTFHGAPLPPGHRPNVRTLKTIVQLALAEAMTWAPSPAFSPLSIHLSLPRAKHSEQLT